MDIIFASHNENKVQEIRTMMPKDIKLLSLNDMDYQEEIEETGSTLEENAEIKAKTIYTKFGKNVFADDSGLFVEALDGAPGVFSARYAGTGNARDNIEKLLKQLEGKTNRNAYFKAVFCLIIDGQTHFLSGQIDGKILETPKGDNGFGYDPIFVPNGFEKSFAEMNSEIKNQMSHRFKAVQKLINFIQNS